MVNEAPCSSVACTDLGREGGDSTGITSKEKKGFHVAGGKSDTEIPSGNGRVWIQMQAI